MRNPVTLRVSENISALLECVSIRIQLLLAYEGVTTDPPYN